MRGVTVIDGDLFKVIDGMTQTRGLAACAIRAGLSSTNLVALIDGDGANPGHGD